MIERSYTLADIPPDLTGLGRIRTADVYAVAGTTRRKRSEIAVAIDFQSINIYDVQVHKFAVVLHKLTDNQGQVLETSYIVFCFSTIRLHLSSMFDQKSEARI